MEEKTNNRKVGACWEEKAAKYLEDQGMRILEKNFRNRYGEIDLIGRQEGYLVFVEVKYRKTTEKGYAVEAVGVAKQRQICKVADYYRLTHGVGNHVGVRYDVVAFQGEKIEWVKNAFLHISSLRR